MTRHEYNEPLENKERTMEINHIYELIASFNHASLIPSEDVNSEKK